MISSGRSALATILPIAIIVISVPFFSVSAFPISSFKFFSLSSGKLSSPPRGYLITTYHQVIIHLLVEKFYDIKTQLASHFSGIKKPLKQ